MLSTLRVRLLLVGVGVALFAVVVSAFAVQRLTENEIRGSLDNQVRSVREIQDELVFAASFEAGWGQIDDDVERLSEKYDERIALVGADGKVLADSEVERFGREAPLPRQAFVLDPGSAFLAPTPSSEVIERFEETSTRLSDCLADFGITFDTPAGDFGIDGFELESIDIEQLDSIDVCFNDIGADVGGFEIPGSFGEPGAATRLEIPAVQLFVGYGDTSSNSLFPSLWSWRFWLAIGLPLLAAAVAMVLTARRMLGPIDSLTTAAEKMHGGDLTTRVDVRGRDEIARLGGAFNEMAGALQASDQARRTLTSDVAHELRSPLANLRGWIEGVQDGVVEPSPEVMSSLHEEALHLQALVEDLQDLSLAEAGQLPLHRELTSLEELLRRVGELHEPTALAAQVTITVEVDDAISASVDRRRIHQVLVNLVANAVRHTPAGGAVSLRLRRLGNEAVIDVADTGSGIPAEHLPMIFDRFWRGDVSRTRSTGGSGLGLAIVRQLVVAHGGAVSVTSTVGTGSTFTVRLPAAHMWAPPTDTQPQSSSTVV
jgi:two-component system, OmpR family, sensor histidine kinase BaeS